MARGSVHGSMMDAGAGWIGDAGKQIQKSTDSLLSTTGIELMASIAAFSLSNRPRNMGETSSPSAARPTIITALQRNSSIRLAGMCKLVMQVKSRGWILVDAIIARTIQ